MVSFFHFFVHTLFQCKFPFKDNKVLSCTHTHTHTHTHIHTHTHTQNMSLWIAWIYQYTCTKAQQRRLDLYLFQAILHFTKDSSSLCKWQWQPLPKDTQTHDKGSGLGCLVIYHILRHAASSIQVKSDSNSQ